MRYQIKHFNNNNTIYSVVANNMKLFTLNLIRRTSLELHGDIKVSSITQFLCLNMHIAHTFHFDNLFIIVKLVKYLLPTVSSTLLEKLIFLV